MPPTRKTINLIKPPRRSSDFLENLKVVLGIYRTRPPVAIKSYDPSVKYEGSGPSRSRAFLEDLKVVLGIGQPEPPEVPPGAGSEFSYKELAPSNSAEFMENLKVLQEEEPAAAEPDETEGMEIPFDLLPSSGPSSFLENLKAALGMEEQALTELTSTADPEAPYNELAPSRPAGRGLLYSLLVHEIIIFAVLIIPPAMRPERKFYYVEEWKPFLTKLTYSLPAIGGGHEGGGQKGGGGKPGGGSTGNSASAPRKAPAPAAAARGSGGMVYPAPQTVISNPPNPTNHIQTILQPELVNPPTLKAPLPLPNMVTVARPRLPAPPPLAPKVEPLRTVRPAQQEAPKLQAQMQTPALPFSVPPPPEAPPPAAPKLTLPAAQPEALPAAAPPAPKPFNPKAPAVPTSTAIPGEAPKLPAPSEAVGTDDRSVLILSPTPGPPEEASKIPAGEARGQFAMGPEPNLTASSGFGPGKENGGVSQPGSAAGSESGVPGGTAGATGQGAGPGGVPGEGPGGEGTGSGSGSGGGVGNGIGAGTGPGSGGTGAGGSGSGGGLGSGTGTGTGPGRGEGVGSGSGTGSGFGNGPGRGSGSGTGTGSGAGSGSGTGPFPGITIVGGSGSTGAAARRGSRSLTPPGKRPGYGMTITSTAKSGGGLRDYGIFRNESVYTVYVEMTHSPTPAPSWTLQYSVLSKPASAGGQAGISLWSDQNVLAPYPIAKENPEFPADAVSRNLGRMVVVYGEINLEGKLERLRIIQSPNPLLNAPLLAALAKWTFRPAELNGKPVAVKALLGVPLSLPE